MSLLSLFILAGTVFANPNEKTLYASIPDPFGYQPAGNLVADAAGNLYGTTSWGGACTWESGYGCGTVFRLVKEGDGNWKQQILLNFSGNDGQYPTNVALDGDGNVYAITTYGGAFLAGTVVELTPTMDGSWTETLLYSFTGKSDGARPASLSFSDGILYGTTTYGGNFYGDYQSCGAAFELTYNPSSGWTESTIYAFATTGDACNPSGSLVARNKTTLLGVSSNGGAYGVGAVFELTKSAQGQWQDTVIHSFESYDIARPISLVAAGSGIFYGSAFQGGSADLGGVFELKNEGPSWSYTVLYKFAGGQDGAEPQGVTLDSSGALYGTTFLGGGSSACVDGCGTVFRLTPDGENSWKEAVVHRFINPLGGAYGAPGLLFDTLGNIYGATLGGGSQACAGPNSLYHGCGTVFEMTPSGNGMASKVIFSFPNLGGFLPSVGLVADSSGNLYGTSDGGAFGWGAVFELMPTRRGQWQAKMIYSFRGSPDGGFPESTLIFDRSGSLYGTTFSGGTGSCNEGFGCGTVFRLMPQSQGEWSETVLYSFAGGTDGGGPIAGLVFDNAGNLYGATSTYGLSGCEQLGGEPGCGTIFELSPDAGIWKETILHAFGGTYSDGAGPEGALVFDTAGNLYGTTKFGGNNPNQFGTVFEVSPSGGGQWTETVLYNFTDSTDGANPVGGLVFDPSGNLYGATLLGGAPGCGCGVIFELSPLAGGGWADITLHDFTLDDGAYPVGPLALDKAGNLYGATRDGGVFSGQCVLAGCGVVFQLVPASGGWTENILHSFVFSDGEGPTGILLDGAGNIYGTTAAGGPADDGMAFEVTTATK